MTALLSLLSQIHYWEKDKQNETEKVKVLFVPDTSVRLKNLTAYTSYQVKLSAFNAAGDGPMSVPRKGRTLQAGESQCTLHPRRRRFEILSVPFYCKYFYPSIHLSI